MDLNTHRDELRAADALERAVDRVLKDFKTGSTTLEHYQLLQQAWVAYRLQRQRTPAAAR